MDIAGNTFYFTWETGLMEWLQANISPAWITFISYLSMFGEEVILILIMGILYWGYDKRIGKTVGLCVLTALVWNPMIKNIARRRRPYFDNEGIRILRVVEPKADIYDIAAQGYSLPSGHSSNAVSLYGSVANTIRKRIFTILSFILPVAVGFSRVVVGAHYPTDVLAGWLIGGIAIAVVSLLQARLKDTLLIYGILLVTALPGLFYCRSNDYFTGLGLLIGFMAGTLFEDKVVKFENTKSPVIIAVRLLGGVTVYLVINMLLKLPFSSEFLSGASYAAMLVRLLRYIIVSFVCFGIYPMLFGRFKS